MAEPEWFGPAGKGRFITDIDYMVTDKHILFHASCPKDQKIPSCRVIGNRTYDCRKKLSTASLLSFSLGCSQKR